MAIAALTTPLSAAPLASQPGGIVSTPVKINDQQTFEFIVDTGASQTVISGRLIDTLALTAFPGASEALMGATGAGRTEVYALSSVEIDGKRKGLIRAIGQRAFPPLGTAQGIIGADFLADHVVDFDFPRNELRLLEASEIPSTRGWRILPITFNRRAFPVLQGLIGGVPVTIILDTGAQLTIVNSAAASKLSQAGDLGGAALPGHRPQARGATGHAVSLQMRNFADFSVGDFKLDPQRIAVADLPVFNTLGLDETPAMILGIDKLRGLRMIVDYPRSRLLIKPGS